MDDGGGLRFSLRPSRARRRDAPLVPCLSLRIPTPDRPWRSIEVVRLLDPEHREPLVSLARLTAAASAPLTPLQTLTRFLSPSPTPSLTSSLPLPPQYSLLLSGLAPFADFWVPLAVARKVANELGMLGGQGRGVEGLLDWGSRTAWTCVEWNEGMGNSTKGERSGELVSNWRVPPSSLAPALYSVESFCNARFDRIELLSGQNLIRLPISHPASSSTPRPLPPALRPLPPSAAFEVISPPSSPANTEESTFEKLLEELCVLSAEEFEASVDSEDPDSAEDREEADPADPFWSKVLGILEGVASLSPLQDTIRTASRTASNRTVNALGSILFSPRLASKPSVSPQEFPPSPPLSNSETLPPPSEGVEHQLSTMQETLDAVLLHLRTTPPPVSSDVTPPFQVREAQRIGAGGGVEMVRTWVSLGGILVLGLAIGWAVGTAE